MESLCELCRTLAKNFTNSMQNCNPTANKITGPQFPSELQQEQRKVLYVVEFKPSKNQKWVRFYKYFVMRTKLLVACVTD